MGLNSPQRPVSARAGAMPVFMPLTSVEFRPTVVCRLVSTRLQRRPRRPRSPRWPWPLREGKRRADPRPRGSRGYVRPAPRFFRMYRGTRWAASVCSGPGRVIKRESSCARIPQKVAQSYGAVQVPVSSGGSSEELSPARPSRNEVGSGHGSPALPCSRTNSRAAVGSRGDRRRAARPTRTRPNQRRAVSERDPRALWPD